MRFPVGVSQSPLDAALQKLREGRTGESGYGQRVALVLTIPARDDAIAWDVRRTASGALYVVRTVWQRVLDIPPRERFPRMDRALWFAERAAIPDRRPSLWSTTVHVDQVALASLLDTIASVTLPCHPERGGAPADATTFEVSFGMDVNETRYRWRGEPPSGWHTLADFANRVIQLVDDPVGATR